MKLLIGYDGSECADAAILGVADAGLPGEGEAVVLSVADVWPQLAGGEAVAASLGGAGEWSPIDFHRAREMAREQLAGARSTGQRGAEKLRDLLAGWKISSEAEADTPHWAIVRRADAWKPDLIVVGSHGRSAVGRFFLGSVSTAVLTHARGSVRIARNAPRTEGRNLRMVLGIDGSPGSAAAAHAVARRNWPRRNPGESPDGARHRRLDGPSRGCGDGLAGDPVRAGAGLGFGDHRSRRGSVARGGA